MTVRAGNSMHAYAQDCDSEDENILTQAVNVGFDFQKIYILHEKIK